METLKRFASPAFDVVTTTVVATITMMSIKKREQYTKCVPVSTERQNGVVWTLTSKLRVFGSMIQNTKS